jgi:hypothetical protein
MLRSSSRFFLCFFFACLFSSAQASSLKFVDTAKIVWANPAKGQPLEETRRLSEFRAEFGEIPVLNRDLDDAYEGIVPTPGAPGTGNWQPGDSVTYVRTGQSNGEAYQRTTRYERLSGGGWGRTANDVVKEKLECSEGVCTSPF